VPHLSYKGVREEVRHTLPQQALQTPLLQLKDAAPSQQTWMPFEQERAARDWVVKRRRTRQVMVMMRVLGRIFNEEGVLRRRFDLGSWVW